MGSSKKKNESGKKNLTIKRKKAQVQFYVFGGCTKYTQNMVLLILADDGNKTNACKPEKLQN